MTRINVLSPKHLCDQHLFAEFRELTRIPNGVRSCKLKAFYSDAPTDYALGPGHVKFFCDKNRFLLKRYVDIRRELEYRGINHQPLPFEDWKIRLQELQAWGDYVPTRKAVKLNGKRIAEKMPKKPRWSVRAPSRHFVLQDGKYVCLIGQ